MGEFGPEVIAFQRAIYSSLVDEQQAPDIKTVFEFICKNFDQLNARATLTSALEMLHHTLNSSNETASHAAVGPTVLGLIESSKDDETKLTVALSILHQLMRTLPKHDPLFLQYGAEVSKVLVALLTPLRSLQLNANILTCLDLSITKFGQNDLIIELWDSLSAMRVGTTASLHTAQLLLHLFDGFLCKISNFRQQPFLVAFVRKLIVSQERELRKAGYMLLKKTVSAVIEDARTFSAWQVDNAAILQRCWNTYIAALENLEENQSHLILPSLEAMKKLDRGGATWREWLDILYVKIFSHNNSLVRRWVLEYFLETYTCAELSPDVLNACVEALNNTSLYNWEGYFLPEAYIERFLSGGVERFIVALSNVNWKSVPLHYWLSKLQSQTNLDISREVFLKLAASIRNLQNPKLRSSTFHVFNNTFKDYIEQMPLSAYVEVVETIKGFGDIDVLIAKLEAANSLEGVTFAKGTYELLRVLLYFFSKIFQRMLKALNVLPSKQHGWLRFLLISTPDFEEDVKYAKEFCKSNYDIDIDQLVKLEINEIMEDLRVKLECKKDEEQFLHQIAVDFFVLHRLEKYEDLETVNLTADYLLQEGSRRTCRRLAKLFSGYTGKVENLEALLTSFFNATVRPYVAGEAIIHVYYLMEYCRKNEANEELATRFAESFLNIDLGNFYICDDVLRSGIKLDKEIYIKGLLLGEEQTGDGRIEHIYCVKLSKWRNYAEVRDVYLSNVKNELALDVVKDLIKLNNELSTKRPRYFEHSKEHCLKMRIVYAIDDLVGRYKFYDVYDDLWSILLEQNNQLNVTIAYENLAARLTTSVDAIKAKLIAAQDYTPSQQVSVISVATRFCLREKKQIHHELLPFTMGANFQTRLYAQLCMYKLLQQKWAPADAFCYKNAIKQAIGDRLDELMADVRLVDSLDATKIFFITNAPIDEISPRYSSTRSESIQKAKALFSKKLINVAKGTTQETIELPSSSTNNVQKKMNPNELLQPSNLIYYPNSADKEIYVLASLVKNLPNLGGIARTCEVLGIKNLVLHNKLVVEQTDFKNLSMTAETGLNIVEVKREEINHFLIEKRLEGFKIIGAEQTSSSEEFSGFQFPKKCVLVLGHEKEGIPFDVLGFIDKAVEIPQFGKVRSLNVHVTAALFMWEYCKQHIVE